MTITTFDFKTQDINKVDDIASSFITTPTREEQEALRQAAYTAEADPIAMQMLRDEATKEEWLAKIEEIKLRYPYP